VIDQDRLAIGRRAVVLGGLAAGAVALSGCTGSSGPDVSARTRSEPTTSEPPETVIPPATSDSPPPPEEALPSSRVWPIRPSEVEPEIKRAAIRLLETLSQWSEGGEGRRAAARRLRDLPAAAGRVEQLVYEGRPLLGRYSEATVRVLATQYGGMLPSSASVLVALRQWKRRDDDTVLRTGSTVDVRLAEVDGQWQVTRLRPSRPGPPLRPEPRLVERVVEHPRIHLPPAARADVLAGSLCPFAMSALVRLAKTYEIDVSVVHTGHPYFVFGTRRLSDHTRKRAFDVWAINGQPIVSAETPHRLVDGFMRDAVAAGAYNVGGPRPLAGGAYFSDATHHDHTHIAFNRWR
jgi:hypothetical protein